MTKKIRENLLILLISNIITIILFVTAPYIISMGHRTKRFFQWSGKMGERF